MRSSETESLKSEEDSLLGAPVDPGKIDAGLLRLWQDHETATRASLMNLAIYSEAPGSLLENTRTVQPLTLEHACRVLLIEALPKSSSRETEAWITAHCSLGADGRKAVCCEQLAFRMHGYSPARLTNLLFANLESDLPLVLWWQVSLRSHFDKRIHARIDRLVIDSHSWEEDPASEFRCLLTAYQNREHYFVVHDLNWTRTLHLRLAIAAGFEDAAAVQALAGLERIEIEHGPGWGTTACLLGAWLLERLQHQKHGQEKGGPGAVAVVFHEGSVAETGPIARVSFVTGAGHFTLERGEGPYYRWKGIASAAAMPFHAGPVDVSELLIDQLGRGGSNAAYLPVVRRALQLLEGTTSSALASRRSGEG